VHIHWTIWKLSHRLAFQMHCCIYVDTWIMFLLLELTWVVEVVLYCTPLLVNDIISMKLDNASWLFPNFFVIYCNSFTVMETFVIVNFVSQSPATSEVVDVSKINKDCQALNAEIQQLSRENDTLRVSASHFVWIVKLLVLCSDVRLVAMVLNRRNETIHSTSVDIIIQTNPNNLHYHARLYTVQ